MSEGTLSLRFIGVGKNLPVALLGARLYVQVPFHSNIKCKSISMHLHYILSRVSEYPQDIVGVYFKGQDMSETFTEDYPGIPFELEDEKRTTFAFFELFMGY